jgi:predicted nucleic acid-binding protein
MIFTPSNEGSAVLDACVLVPMALCDLLLRLAEGPSLYRPLWSVEILDEMSAALQHKLGRTAKEAARRQARMMEAFPEAMVAVPAELVRAADCIPDAADRHVLAVAIMARSRTIVTQNTRHFPQHCLEKFGILGQTPDDFLIHQYQREAQLVLDKLDDQAAGISESREFVVASLSASVGRFCQLLRRDKI